MRFEISNLLVLTSSQGAYWEYVIDQCSSSVYIIQI